MCNEAIPPSNQNPIQNPKNLNKNPTKTQQIKQREFNSPVKQSPTIAFILASATDFGVSFAIGLNGVVLRTLTAFPFLLAVLSAKVLFNPSQITKSSRGIVMNT